MIVQIYSLTNANDVRALIDLGVDHFGFAVGEQGLPAEIPVIEARELFELVPDGRKTSMLVVETEVDDIVDLARSAAPDIVHICSDTHAVSPDNIEEIRNRLSGIEVMKSINVAGTEAIDAARQFDSASDYLLLDTATENIPGIGASGETHDWSISRRVVEETNTPVILAGGLSPNNVAEAVRKVNPDGVDSYTRTSKTERVKNLTKVRRFVKEARHAAESTTE